MNQKLIRINPAVCTLIVPVAIVTYLVNALPSRCLFCRQVKYVFDLATGKTTLP